MIPQLQVLAMDIHTVTTVYLVTTGTHTSPDVTQTSTCLMDFTFEYFGTEYNGSDTKNRVHIGRMGNMYFKADGSTSLERSITSWYSNMPELPYAASTYSRPGTIAPWWGYYTSYYCYDNAAADCSVRTRVIPFEGKGTDVTQTL